MIYGLFHVAADRRHSSNLRGAGPEKAIEIYFANALTLRNSLAAVGHDFTLLTNDAATLERLNCDKFQAEITLRAIPFPLDVPPTMPYYSAHHKIDVFRWFASGAAGSYPVLVDLDVVALRAPTFLAGPRDDIPLVYDASDQVLLLYGAEVAADIRRLAGRDVPVTHWYGGEFIAGPPSFYGTLVERLSGGIWQRYCASFGSFHHQGDEMPVSAALSTMLADGHVIVDVGPVGGVGRFNSWMALYPQKPFWWFERCAFLHVPSDKYFLAKQAARPFDAERFLASYRRYLALRRVKEQANCLAKLALRKRRYYSAKFEVAALARP